MNRVTLQAKLNKKEKDFQDSMDRQIESLEAMKLKQNKEHMLDYIDSEISDLKKAKVVDSYVLMNDTRIEFIREVERMDNRTLFTEYTESSRGDDYDGCFTEQGYWANIVLTTEMEQRLGI